MFINDGYLCVRDLLYLKGGVLFVTSRILVVDLLKRQCPAESVSGILVYNAHRYCRGDCRRGKPRLLLQSNNFIYGGFYSTIVPREKQGKTGFNKKKLFFPLFS